MAWTNGTARFGFEMKLLDTSVVVDFLRGRGEAIRLLTDLTEVTKRCWRVW